MSDNKKKSSDGEMTFFEHIDALRPHLVRAAGALFIMMIGGFFGRIYIIDTILMGPKSPDFITNKLLCSISHALMGNDGLCINNVEFNTTNFTLGGQFNLTMQVAFVTAIVIGIPYFLWEIWRFIRPALTPFERQKSHTFVFYVSLCFFVGLLFGYFLIVPLSINFLFTFQASPDIMNMIDIKSYLKTVIQVSLACAVVFQLPLLIYFLTRMGIVNAPFLRKYRRHAIVLLAVLSAIITPPDLLSLFLVMLPLYALYELSITIAAKVEKKKAQEEAEEMARLGLKTESEIAAESDIVKYGE